jgi:putative DNA primase/helicase
MPRIRAIHITSPGGDLADRVLKIAGSRQGKRIHDDDATVFCDRPGSAKAGDTDSSLNVPEKSRLITIRASALKIRNIDFIWPGRLARGKHTCIAGEGGLGKSQLLIFMLATVTRGGIWPCGEGCSPSGKVMILSAEDGAEDVLAPRLLAAGADMDRVEIVKRIAAGKREGERRFSLLSDLEEMEKKIFEVGDVAMVGIDPVSSYMGKADSHNNTALRGVLDPITEMAERTNVAFVSITHFNKGQADKGIKAVHRVMGGAAFTTAPRAAFGVIEDPDDESRRLLLHLKTNIGPKPQGLAYRFGQSKVGVDDRDGEDILATHVVWDSEPVSTTADQALGGGGNRDPTVKEDRIEFLKTVLADGPMPVSEVAKEARSAAYLKEGELISQSKPFRDARKVLGIKPYQPKGVKSGGWLWALPGRQMPSSPSDAL